MSLTDIEKEMKRLNTNKASHSSDIPTKILKQNVDFFSAFILDYVNKSVSLSTFPSILKLADIIPSIQKRFSIREKLTIGLSVSYQIYLKSLKMYFMTKFLSLYSLRRNDTIKTCR